jgi:hypothetical protein
MKILQRHLGNFLYLSSIFPAIFLLFSFTTDPTVLETILKKLKQYHADRPQEKLYLHLDKPFYAAGDNVWFKAYLIEASFHSLDSQSRVVYVELIDNNHTVFKRQMLFTSGGVTFGDFQLPDTLHEGNYAIRAYTNYMKNVGEDFFFTKEFSVLNPLLGHSKQANTNFSADSIELQFFPEGGNFVACGFNRLGFKALSPDGKGINVEGTIVDDNNVVITSFKSQHKGMGVVRVNPLTGRKYYARITKPYAVNRAYPLPDVHEKGYIMQVDAVTKNIKVIVFTNDKPASGDHSINIVVQSRGNAYHAQQGVIKDNAFFTLIPKSTFPDGISQITVFDSQGRPVAERLIHQDHHETINLIVETDTTSYGKRKMVTVLADAQYRNGSPAAGSFSISVYDEGLIQSPEKHPLSITNYLSLTSDLKGNIEDPGYYFKDSLIETKKNLDLLMMVHGWRRFTWKDVLEDKSNELTYKREQGIPVSGKVLKAAGKRPPTGSILKVLTMDGKVVRLRPDSLGRFYTDSLLYYDSMTLVFQTENHKGKKQPYQFKLEALSPPALSTHKMSPFFKFDASNYLKQQADERMIINSTKDKVLEEVVVVAKREPDPRLLGGGGGGRVLDVKKMHGETYGNIFQLMQSKLPGVVVTGGGASYTVKIRNQDAIFLLDGRVTDINFVSLYSPADVDYIQVLTNSVLYGGNVINIILKEGGGTPETIGVNQIKHPGFYQGREFYSPQYDVKDNRHSFEDKRTTLFWEPMMMTDQAGRSAIAFYTGDVASRYRVVIEGITADGYPGTATTTFEVK